MTMTRSQLENLIVAQYGTTYGELFLKVTGLPTWAVEAGPEASKARSKWKRFIDKIAASNSITIAS